MQSLNNCEIYMWVSPTIFPHLQKYFLAQSQIISRYKQHDLFNPCGDKFVYNVTQQRTQRAFDYKAVGSAQHNAIN